MSIRSQQDLNTDPVLLFASSKMGGSNKGETGVYVLPGDEESGEEKGSAFGHGEENVMEIGLKEILTNDERDAAPSNDASEASAANSSSDFDPRIVFPPSYGGAIVACFAALIEYERQVSLQGFQMGQDLALAMTGKDGQKGLIQSQVDAGMASAQAQGDQMKSTAIGQGISAGVCGFSLLGGGVGYLRNCTNTCGTGLKMFQTNRGVADAQVKDAEAYSNMLENPSKKAAVNIQDDQEGIELQPMGHGQAEKKTEENVVERPEVKARIEEMKQGVNMQCKEEDNVAVAHMKEKDQAAWTEAKKKADEQKKNLSEYRDRFETAKYNNSLQFWNSISTLGTNAGQAGGGVAASNSAIESGKQKALSDATQQANQTEEGSKEKGFTTAKDARDQMSQLAQSLAQALNGQVQVRG